MLPEWPAAEKVIRGRSGLALNYQRFSLKNWRADSYFRAAGPGSLER
jgi:hypothetical protein